MKITLVSNGFPPASYGGVEAYTFDLAKGLTARGHEVSVFCRESAPGSNDYQLIREAGSAFPIYRVVNDYKKIESFARLYADPVIDRIFEEVLAETRPELVHFNHFIALSANLPKITASRNIPAMITLHDYWPICHRVNLINAYANPCPGPLQGGNCFDCVFLAGERGHGLRNRAFFYLKRLLPYPVRAKLRQKIRRPGFGTLLFKASHSDFTGRQRSFVDAIRSGNYLSVPSEFVRQVFLQNGFEALKIHVLPLGIEKLSPVSHHGKNKRIRFAYIGTVLTVKGLDLLISAFSRLPDENIELAIYGREDVEPHYTRHIHDIARKDLRIKFMGAFPAAKKQEIYDQIDIVVIPSITHETFSFVAREALSAGVPVIASAMGALKEIINSEKNGYLFPAKNVAALSKIIHEIAREPQVLTKLICPGNIEIITVDEHVSRIEDIYYEIIGNRV